MQYNIILHITQRNTLFYSVTVPHLFDCGPRKCVPRIFFGEEPFPGSRPWQGMMKPVLMRFAPLCLDSL